MNFLVLLICIFITRSSLIYASKASLDKSSEKPVDKPKVLVEEIKLANDQKRILVPAKIDSKIQSVVTADIEAHVIQILKPLGSLVKSGDIVLFLENKDPGFTFAKVPVRSPISGVISQMMTTQMAKVARGDKLFNVINPKTLKISAEFSSSDSSFIKIGSTGTFKFNNLSNQVRIVGFSPLIDARTGTASAELEFLPTESNLPLIGTIGQIAFEITQGQIILVPENALFYNDGKSLVRILKSNNQVEKKIVELGDQRENLFVVKSGLKTGEKIVVRSSRPIKEGELIEIEKPDVAASEKN